MFCLIFFIEPPCTHICFGLYGQNFSFNQTLSIECEDITVIMLHQMRLCNVLQYRIPKSLTTQLHRLRCENGLRTVFAHADFRLASLPHHASSVPVWCVYQSSRWYLRQRHLSLSSNWPQFVLEGVFSHSWVSRHVHPQAAKSSWAGPHLSLIVIGVYSSQ